MIFYVIFLISFISFFFRRKCDIIDSQMEIYGA